MAAARVRLDVDISQFTPIIHDQRTGNTCYETALTDLVTTTFRIESDRRYRVKGDQILGLDFELSPQVLIDQRLWKKEHHLRDYVVESGLYKLSDCPMIGGGIPAQFAPTFTVGVEAEVYQLRDLWEFGPNVNDMFNALIDNFGENGRGYPVFGSIYADEAFQADLMIDPYQPHEVTVDGLRNRRVRGNHAVLIVGINTNSDDPSEHHVVIKNSYSDWGNGGFWKVFVDAFDYICVPNL